MFRRPKPKIITYSSDEDEGVVNVVSDDGELSGKEFVPLEEHDVYESNLPKRAGMQDQNEFDLDEQFSDGALAIGENEQNVHDQMRRKEIEDAINDAQMSDESHHEEMMEWEQKQIHQGAIHSETAPIYTHGLRTKKVPSLQEEISRLQKWLEEMHLMEEKYEEAKKAFSTRGAELAKRKADLLLAHEDVMRKYAVE